MNQRERYSIIADIRDRLSELGAEEWYKERLARKIFQHFSDDPIGVLNTFHKNGWNTSDVYHWLKQSRELREGNPSWADSFHHIFFLEQMFVNAGLSKKTAHSLVLTQPWMFSAPPFTLEFSVKTLVHLGYDEEIILSIANKMHCVFLWLPDHIIEECKRASEEGKGLLSNTKLADVKLEPRPAYYQRNVEDASQNPVMRRAKVKVTPLPTPLPPTSSIEPAKTTEKSPKNVKPLPKLRLFNPSANPISPKPPPVQTDEDVEEGNRKEKIVYREVTPDNENTTHATLELRRFRSLILAANPDSDEDLWNKYYAANDWLARVDSCEYQACLLLNHWVPLHSEITPTQLEYKSGLGVRARFWRSILLDEKIHTVLQVSAEILELRMYVVRRIGRNFLKEPEWLLCEWEVLDEVELRYRCNLIDACGKKPDKKPYINMLLEPDRDKFKKRLGKFLSTLARYT